MASKTKLKINKIIQLVKSKKFNALLQLFLVFVIFFNVGMTVFEHREKYLSPDYWQKFPQLEKIYYNSIYKNKHGNFLRDEVVYSYIGGALVRGKSPILLNPEVPPLGNYLIGLSIIVFNNPNIIILGFALMSLFMMYQLGKQIFNKNVFAILPPVLLSFEPIFKNQLIYTPLLDIIQLFFLLCIFYLFNKSRQKNKNSFVFILLTNIFLGFFISTKFFGTGITVIAALLLPLFINRDWNRLKYLLVTLPLSVLILYATYFKVLLDGYPINRFLGIQKWIFLYNKGHLLAPLSVWPLLLLNKWYIVSIKKISSDSQWVITWPLLVFITTFIIIFNFIKKINKAEIEVLFFWTIFYLLLISFVDASSRYFVILIPILYIISIYAIIELIKLKVPRVKKFYENRN